MRRQNWERIFAEDISDKGLAFKIYKNLLKLNKKMNDPIIKWAKDMNMPITKDTQMAKKKAYEKILNVS